MPNSLLFATMALFIVVSPATAQQSDSTALQQQVMAAERAFATTMADRDFDSFMTHLSDEAIFFNGEAPIRGKAAVAAAWKSFYSDSLPPFSWEPDRVEVLESGTLALSTGPVRRPEKS
jgi:ketosteroid isomerase-like protein